MSNKPHDELAVWSLGHECPDPASCSKSLRFPAQAAGADGHVLLVGCLHNLGSRLASVSAKEGPAVDITALVQSRSTRTGTSGPLVAPGPMLLPVRSKCWLTRSVRRESNSLQCNLGQVLSSSRKPSNPSMCDAVQFNAMLPKDCLLQVLKASGHQGLYAVPSRPALNWLHQGFTLKGKPTPLKAFLCRATIFADLRP